MSSRNSAQTGTPSRIGVTYADCFSRRGPQELSAPHGRTQTKVAVERPLPLTNQRSPLLMLSTNVRNNSQIRIISIAGHPIVQEGIGAIISAQPDISPIAAAATGKEGIEAYRAARPDVTLLDLQLPD